MAQIMVTIPDDLLVVYNRVLVESGGAWANNYLTERLRTLAASFWTSDAEAAFVSVTPRPTR